MYVTNKASQDARALSLFIHLMITFWKITTGIRDLFMSHVLAKHHSDTLRLTRQSAVVTACVTCCVTTYINVVFKHLDFVASLFLPYFEENILALNLSIYIECFNRIRRAHGTN